MTKADFIKSILPSINTNVVSLINIDESTDPEFVVAQNLCIAFDISSVTDILKIYSSAFYEYIPDDYFIKITKGTASTVKEFPQSAVTTATFGRGDCEDIARLQYFIYKCLNITPYILIVFYVENSTLYGHALTIGYTKSDNLYTVYVQDFNKIYIHNTLADPVLTAIGMYRYVRSSLVFASVLDVKPWTGTYDNRLEAINIFDLNELPTAVKPTKIEQVAWNTSSKYDYSTYLYIVALVIGAVVLVKLL